MRFFVSLLTVPPLVFIIVAIYALAWSLVPLVYAWDVAKDLAKWTEELAARHLSWLGGSLK